MKKPLLLAVILGIIAGLFLFLYLNSLETTYSKGAQKVKVLVAKGYIDQASMLDESLVEVKEVPKSYLQPRALQSLQELSDAEGRQVFMSVVPIEKGEQIITTKLYMLGMDTGISAIIPSEQRAVTLVFDKELVSGIIKPGNRVDIIGIFDYDDKKGQTHETALTLLQNTLVLSVGKSLLGAIKPVMKNKRGFDNAMLVESSANRVPVSFSVTPAQSELLAFSAEKSVIKLALRATGDHSIYDTKGVSMNDLFSDVSSSRNSTGGKSAANSKYLKELQRRQDEALKILKKYKSK